MPVEPNGGRVFRPGVLPDLKVRPPKILSLNGVVKSFDATRAVDGLTFDVAPGEMFGLIGPDGAGKTTLIRILVTLLLPDAGRAEVLGLDVARNLRQLRLRVGYMPGRFSLYPDLSVAENLRFFASVFGTTVAKEYESIAPIYRQLEPFAARRAGNLSGGMKQKLALCCALVHRPEILFLDEPTTGVDAVSRREFWDLLGRLRQGGLTVLVSTPYMDEASRCERVGLMHGGRFLAVDTPAAIERGFDQPIIGIRGSERFRLLQTLRAFPHQRSVYPFGETLHYTDARSLPAPAIEAELRAYLHDKSVGDVAVGVVPPTIEDVFMARMTAAAGGTP
jgi:ABC-type multidrug transport system ATPase subunit